MPKTSYNKTLDLYNQFRKAEQQVQQQQLQNQNQPVKPPQTMKGEPPQRLSKLMDDVETATSKGFTGLLIFILFLVAVFTFARNETDLSDNSGKIYALETTWWGLHKERTELRWMQESGSDHNEWCALNKSGQWEHYFARPEDIEEDGPSRPNPNY